MSVAWFLGEQRPRRRRPEDGAWQRAGLRNLQRYRERAPGLVVGWLVRPAGRPGAAAALVRVARAKARGPAMLRPASPERLSRPARRLRQYRIRCRPPGNGPGAVSNS